MLRILSNIVTTSSQHVTVTILSQRENSIITTSQQHRHSIITILSSNIWLRIYRRASNEVRLMLHFERHALTLLNSVYRGPSLWYLAHLSCLPESFIAIRAGQQHDHGA